MSLLLSLTNLLLLKFVINAKLQNLTAGGALRMENYSAMRAVFTTRAKNVRSVVPPQPQVGDVHQKVGFYYATPVVSGTYAA
mmetsp:Transcript_12022/g.33884  ORF Transcript_12022/g.33884 Transcript_12022/m.33884 type:complete len:82 (+) Transcript_12022:116-361(+)